MRASLKLTFNALDIFEDFKSKLFGAVRNRSNPSDLENMFQSILEFDVTVDASSHVASGSVEYGIYDPPIRMCINWTKSTTQLAMNWLSFIQPSVKAVNIEVEGVLVIGEQCTSPRKVDRELDRLKRRFGMKWYAPIFSFFNVLLF